MSEEEKQENQPRTPGDWEKKAFGFLPAEQTKQGDSETIKGLIRAKYSVEGRTVILEWRTARKLRPEESVCCYRNEGCLAPEPIAAIQTPSGVDLSLAELGEPVLDRNDRAGEFRDRSLQEDSKYGYTFFIKRPTVFSDRLRGFFFLPRWGGGDGFRISELLRFLVHVPLGERSEKMGDAADQLEYGDRVKKGMELHRDIGGVEQQIASGSQKDSRDLSDFKANLELSKRRMEAEFRHNVSVLEMQRQLRAEIAEKHPNLSSLEKAELDRVLESLAARPPHQG